jgi:hypothetical protein
MTEHNIFTVTKIQVGTHLQIKNAPGVADPIDVYFEDPEPGHGKITITCFGESWTAYWAAMGNDTLAEFFCGCDVGYIASKLSTISSSHSKYPYLCNIIKAVQSALSAEARPAALSNLERLKEIGAIICTQDNRATDQPMFIVQQIVRDYGYDSSHGDDDVWLNPEGDYEEAPERLIPRLDALHDGCRSTDPWQRCYYKERYEFVTACFTAEGCQDFININGHNLNQPRIYAESSFRNREFRDVRSALMALAGDDKQQEKKGNYTFNSTRLIK